MEGLVLVLAGVLTLAFLATVAVLGGSVPRADPPEYTAAPLPRVHFLCPSCGYRTADRQDLTRLPDGLWCGSCFAEMLPDPPEEPADG